MVNRFVIETKRENLLRNVTEDINEIMFEVRHENNTLVMRCINKPNKLNLGKPEVRVEINKEQAVKLAREILNGFDES